MTTSTRSILGCLGATGLAVALAGVLVVLNWDAVSKRFGGALEEQSRKTKATLFRLGELASMSVELKRQYGAEPEMTYRTETGARVLNITFSNYPLPEGTPQEVHARGIALFALGKTTRGGEIDTVAVAFRDSEKNDEAVYRFSINELLPQDD